MNRQAGRLPSVFAVLTSTFAWAASSNAGALEPAAATSSSTDPRASAPSGATTPGSTPALPDAPPGGGAAPAPTSPAPTSPAPISPAPTSPAPTSPAPTSPAPIPPGSTAALPDAPPGGSAAPAPISPAPTSPAPTPPGSTAALPDAPPTGPNSVNLATAAAHATADGAAAPAGDAVLEAARPSEGSDAADSSRAVAAHPGESLPPPIPEGVRLLLSGVITLGITYMPALVVANESPLPVDQKLYIPFAGPWLDLGNRPGCGSLAIPCSPEGGYRALLVADGILQAVSAIEILAGLNQMKHHDAPARTAGADKPALLRVAPTSVGPGALGMIAVGRF